MQTNLRQKACPIVTVVGGNSRAEIMRAMRKLLEGIGYVYHLDGNDGFVGVYTCQNLINCTH